MQQVECAICEKKGNYDILFRQNFDPSSLNKKIFSARRPPDLIHYQIVKCSICGLVYSTPILGESKLENLYKKSELTYGSEIPYLKKTYGDYLKRFESLLPGKEKLLDIGCGSGFFLEEAKTFGFREVYGVEPSKDAIEKASPAIKDGIINSVFKKGLFKNEFFDAVCFFQTLDHINKPNAFLSEVWRILKRGGLVLAINHDASSLFSKLLGEKCPIYDVEHTYLYDKSTMKKLFEKYKFKVTWVGGVSNTYPLNYWLRMSPLPFKNTILKLLSIVGFGGINLTLSGGNLGLVGIK